MFSPMGNKKALLQMKLGLEVTAPIKAKQSLDATNMTSKNKETEAASSPQKSSNDTKSAANSIASTTNLERALCHVGSIGVVMNRILDSTVRYRPERDAIVLKAFQSKHIPYDIFRNSLYSTFWLSFNEEEYQALIGYFDPTTNGVINGYDFMIAFIRLNGMRKDRMAIEVREKQEAFEKQTREDEERKKLELDKKMELAANFKFSDEARQRAHNKLISAAIKFDASHPSTPSLEGFYVSTMKPYTFRELIKLTFNLKVDRDELGAILKAFDSDISEQNINVNASDFLKYFLRLGFDGRAKQKTDQRKRQLTMTEAALEENLKKMNAANEKLLLTVDYNFGAADETSAMSKILDASTKYDKNAPGSVSLDGFECESLDAGQFKDILRRVFNIQLTNTELGYLVQKYDVKKNGNVFCKAFLTDFFRLGAESRHKLFVEQLEKQRKAQQEAHVKHLKKIHAVQNSESVKMSSQFTDGQLQSALDKLTEASIRYDKVRGQSLISFDPSHLTPLEFKKAVKRTFNLKFTANELGALVNYFDRDESGKVHCQSFLTTFTTLGAAEKYKLKSTQLQEQRDAWQKMKEEDEKKVLTLASKASFNESLEFNDTHKESAMAKLTEAATKYDANHPSAFGLDGFERSSMEAGEFKELVRRTFNLKLSPQEVGAIFKMFDNSDEGSDYPMPTDEINCDDFLKYFLSLGFQERSKVHKEQLEKQRRENKEREDEHRKKIEELATRVNFTVDSDWTEEDKDSIMLKINHASEGFDKNHPAAPSLEAFEVSHMAPGLFRENLKRVFNITSTPKEIGYLLSIFDIHHTGKIDSKEFMMKFQSIGKEIRSHKRKEFLAAKRAAAKAVAKEAEDKLAAQYEKSELQVDYDCAAEDYNSSVEKMTIASSKYDKTHPSAPDLSGFTGGPIKPGVFRELMRRAFNVWFTPKELGAIVMRNRHPSDPQVIDGKMFLIGFLKLGYDHRSHVKAHTIEKQRKVVQEREQERQRKLHLAAQRIILEVESDFTDSDRAEGLKKLKAAAVKYDKTSPGCVSLEAFDAAYLPPGLFREVIKRTLNITFTPKEMAAMVAEFDNGHGNIDSQLFLVSFIKMGSDERDKIKILQLDKQRKQNHQRKTEHERKMKEAEDKMTMSVDYQYSEEDRGSAFLKLAAAAKKYDKSHPGSMSLDGFEEKFLKAHVFREMLKRTFNVILSNGELGAVMHYFDKNRTGMVFSRKFLIYFLKVGIVEREKDHRTSLYKLREDAHMREREHTEKLAAQWAKIELNLVEDFTPAEKETAIEKLTEAAMKFDPASPGPMGLTAFEAQSLSPAVFREMLKRSFNMKVTPGELAALVSEFDTLKNKQVDCKEFMVRFTLMGFERRTEIRKSQLQRQRTMHIQAKEEQIAKKEALDSRLDANLDSIYNDEDVHSALEKIRVIASNYDRAHASAPSLEGFMGTDMKPYEFKDMLSRTFHVTLSNKELTAMVNYFPVEGSTKVELGSSQKPNIRINNKEFLLYFNKIQREEQSKRRKDRIMKERELIQKEITEKSSILIQKQQTELKQLEFTASDEVSMLEKIRQAAQEYAIDSAIYTEALQGFKGPALPANKFQDLFRRVFSIKLTFPELGVLLSILDIGGIGTFDGGKFLNWFYKLSRIEEQSMLGHSSEVITMDTLRVNVVRPKTVQPSTAASAGSRANTTAGSMKATSSASSKFNMTSNGTYYTPIEQQPVIERVSSKEKTTALNPHAQSQQKGSSYNYPIPSTTSPAAGKRYQPFFFEDEYTEDVTEASQSQVDNTALTFTKSTLEKAWFLPSVAGTLVSAASQSTELPNAVDAQESRDYLRSIFAATVDNDSALQQHSNSSMSLTNADSMSMSSKQQQLTMSSMDKSSSVSHKKQQSKDNKKSKSTAILKPNAHVSDMFVSQSMSMISTSTMDHTTTGGGASLTYYDHNSTDYRHTHSAPGLHNNSTTSHHSHQKRGRSPPTQHRTAAPQPQHSQAYIPPELSTSYDYKAYLPANLRVSTDKPSFYVSSRNRSNSPSPERNAEEGVTPLGKEKKAKKKVDPYSILPAGMQHPVKHATSIAAPLAKSKAQPMVGTTTAMKTMDIPANQEKEVEFLETLFTPSSDAVLSSQKTVIGGSSNGTKNLDLVTKLEKLTESMSKHPHKATQHVKPVTKKQHVPTQKEQEKAKQLQITLDQMKYGTHHSEPSGFFFPVLLSGSTAAAAGEEEENEEETAADRVVDKKKSSRSKQQAADDHDDFDHNLPLDNRPHVPQYDRNGNEILKLETKYSKSGGKKIKSKTAADSSTPSSTVLKDVPNIGPSGLLLTRTVDVAAHNNTQGGVSGETNHANELKAIFEMTI